MSPAILEQKRLIKEANEYLRKIEIFEELIMEEEQAGRKFLLKTIREELESYENRYAATITDLTKSIYSTNLHLQTT